MTKGREWSQAISRVQQGNTQEQTVYLCKVDADACMDNTYCETFGKEIKEVIKKFH